MCAARNDPADNLIMDGRHAEVVFLEWSANIDKMVDMHFSMTMEKLNNKKTAGLWVQEFCQESRINLLMYDHSVRVAELALMLAKEMGLCPMMLANIHKGAFLHDIGKLGVPRSVLEKQGKLTDNEYILIYKHPEIGANFLEKFKNLGQFKDIVRHHHERYDGTGYPDRLMGTDIPYEARIVAVADVFDAMTGPRPYRTAFSVSEAIQEMNYCSGSQLDPEIVKILNAIVNKLLKP